MIRILASTSLLLLVLDGCTPSEISSLGQPITSIDATGIGGQTWRVDVLDVRQGEHATRYDVTVAGFPYALELYGNAQTLSAEVIGTDGVAVAHAERRADGAVKVTSQAGDILESASGPATVTEEELGSFDPYALAPLTERVMLALQAIPAHASVDGEVGQVQSALWYAWYYSFIVFPLTASECETLGGTVQSTTGCTSGKVCKGSNGAFVCIS